MPLIDLNGLGHFKDKENEMIAADYSATKTYAVGDYVYYNGTLYRCTTAITTAEAWTSGHWKAAKLADDLTAQSEAIEEFTGNGIIAMILGGYIKTDASTANVNSPVSNANYRYAVVSCSEGDMFTVSATGAYAPRAWAFVASNGSVISNAPQNATVENLVLIAPENSAYLVINDSSNATSYYGKMLADRVSALEASTVGNTNVITKLYQPRDYSEIDTSGAESGVLLKADGTTDTGGSGYIATNYIDVSSYTGFRLTMQMNYGYAVCCFYDSNKVFISSIVSASGATQTKYVNYIVKKPTNAKYVRFGSITTMSVYGATDALPTLCYPDKKWACIGDSLTAANEACSLHYFDYIAEVTGITTINMGVGGTGYKAGEGTTNAFYQRILNVDSTIDVCTVFGSGNDMSYHENFGTYTDTGTTTIAGCVNTFLDNYYSICPTQPIGIIAPSPWYAFPTTTPDNYMEQYVSLLKQIAEYRGVPFLDLYHSSNLRPEDTTNRALCFYSETLDGQGDGVHPNNRGQEIIASKIKSFLETLLL